MTSPRTGRAYLDDVLEQPGSVLALAHRGGVHHPEIMGLENTLAAFEHAVELGYRYLETDVHVTADGVLMAFHDEVLDRVTDGEGEIARLTHSEVLQARVGGREQIPTLTALFDTFPEVCFNIDVKADGAVTALTDFIDARAAHDRVLVGSFSLPRMREFRRRTGGRVATSATPWEVVRFIAAPTAALARRVGRGFDALQVPHHRGRLRVTSPGLVRRAHTARKHLHVWTIDEPGEMRDLLERGVDGLFTDRTDVLKDVLVERDQWRETTA